MKSKEKRLQDLIGATTEQLDLSCGLHLSSLESEGAGQPG